MTRSTSSGGNTLASTPIPIRSASRSPATTRCPGLATQMILHPGHLNLTPLGQAALVASQSNDRCPQWRLSRAAGHRVLGSPRPPGLTAPRLTEPPNDLVRLLRPGVQRGPAGP